MSGKFLTRASAITLALLLAACGGGGDGSSPLASTGDSESATETTDTDTDTGSETEAAASIQLITDIPTIDTAGQTQATITALVRKSGGVLLADAPIEFTADQNAVLQQLATATDDAGSAKASLSSSGDPRNRTITVTATSGSVSESISLKATGTSISLNGPTTVGNADIASYTVKLTDSSGEGIGNVETTITSNNGNPISASTLTTDDSGTVTFSLEATNGGDDTVTVSAYSGESRVSTSATVSIAEDSFVFGTPAENTEIDIAPNTETITVTWSKNGTPVEGQEIEFSATRGSFANGQVTQKVATDATGTASVVIQSNDAGPSLITATGKNADGSIGVSTQRNVEFVAVAPETIDLRATRTQISVNDQTTLVATVRDINGNLVKNTRVNFSVSDNTNGTLSPAYAVTDSQGQASTTYISSETLSDKDGIEVTATIEKQDSTLVSAKETLTVAGEALTITLGTGNEIEEKNTTFYEQPWGVLVTDANGNPSANQTVELSVIPLQFKQGVYVEDEEGDPKWVNTPTLTCNTPHVDSVYGIDIANPATAPTTIQTEDDGTYQFNITYPKSECNWVLVEVTATSSVAGVDSSAKTQFVLPCLADDLNASSPPGGSSSKYNTVITNTNACY